MNVHARRTAPALAAIVFLVALAPPTVRADTPSPVNSWVEPVIIGTVSGNITTASNEYRTRMLDVNQSPHVQQLVSLDFSNTSIRLFGAQNSGITVNCAARTLSRLTDGQGYAIFVPRFAGFENSNRVAVYHEGVLLALVKARSFDIDALDQVVGLNDFSLFAAAFAAIQPHPQTNYNESFSEVPDLGDFQNFVDQFARAAYGAYCP